MSNKFMKCFSLFPSPRKIELEKQVFIIIRFSMLLRNKNMWKSGENSKTWFGYKEAVFSDERLSFRMNLFKKITLPSLAGQDINFSQNNIKVILATSEELPDFYMAELEEISNKYTWLEILKTSEEFLGFKNYLIQRFSGKKKSIDVATIRLDDDDALSIDFVTRVASYQKPMNNGFALSFANGYASIYSEKSNSFSDIKDYFYPKFSAGLAYFDRYNARNKSFEHGFGTVYSLGNHVEVDKKVPLIVDPRGKAFIRTIHKEADTYKKSYQKVEKLSSIKSEVVLNEFPHLINCI